MLKKKLISISILLIVLLLGGYFSDVTAWAEEYCATIEITGGHRYKALRLEPYIYNLANTDLSDLRIKDSHGENVPFFIYNSEKTTSTEREEFALKLIDSYIKDDYFYFDYTLEQAVENDTIATSLEFASPNNNFAKPVAVYGGYDNKNWTFVLSDTIYAIDTAVKLNVDFSQPQKYTHYRLELANNLEQISFSAASLVFSADTSRESYFIESLRSQFVTKEQDKTTRIIIDGLKNLRLCDITIHTKSLFKRSVSAPGGITRELYNISVNEIYLVDLSLPLHGRIAQDDTYIISIDNGDDKPISIDSLIVRYYGDELVFEGDAGEVYLLEFGADSDKTAPVYDIASYKNEILRGELDHVSMGEIVRLTEELPPTRDYKTVFNIVVVIVALVLGAVILVRLKRQ